MARKNLSGNKQRKPPKKNRNNPKFHAKTRNSMRSGDFEPDFDFTYDSEDFLRKFNNSLGELSEFERKHMQDSYEEKLRLEKEKLLHQKAKILADDHSKSKKKAHSIDKLDFDL